MNKATRTVFIGVGGVMAVLALTGAAAPTVLWLIVAALFVGIALMVPSTSS